MGLFDKTVDDRPSAGFDYAETVRLGGGHRYGRHRRRRPALDVLAQHLARVHPVYVVGSKNQDVVRSLIAHDVQVLVDGVGRAGKPPGAAAHLGRDGCHIVAEEGGEPPGAGDVQVKTVALVLGQHHDPQEARIGQV